MKKLYPIALVLLLILSGCRTNDVPPLASPTADALIVAPTSTPANTPPPVSTPTASPQPLQTPSMATPTPIIQYTHGDEGDGVIAIQQRLKELEYFRQEPTGYFGDVTQNALRRFQEKAAIEATGIADAATQEALFHSDAPKNNFPLTGYIIGLDPGHQTHADSGTEPVAPGSDTMKKKVSSGTYGRFTGVREYEVNLDVGLLLRDLLEQAGATVIMTRETNDVKISNVERAQLFNKEKTDYALRLHCNGSNDESVHGAFMLVPTKNPYLEECNLAAQLLIDAYCEQTGAKNRGITKRSDQTGFNWCERMIVNIEMGHMTNEKEDHKLTDPAYQKKMAQGLYNGILQYFETNG